MIWYKFTTPTGSYFSPFSKSKSYLRSYDNSHDLAKDMNKDDLNYQVQSSTLVEIYDKTIPESEPMDLPCGIYSHDGASNVNPERLTPMVIREDKYINLLDSLSNLDESIDQFKKNKELYRESQTLYKLGVLLFGPPGTGKTSYMREFIRKQKDAIVIFLDGVPSRKFIEKIETSTKDTLKIFVFEEAVSLLERSDDIREMLDFLDGSKSISNSIYFMSTNYPESIPENVIRNGRIDVFVRVEFPEVEARKKLINLYLKREATKSELDGTQDMPIVDIRELCFLHKKTGKSFEECGKIVEEKNKMLKRHFGKSVGIKLT
jgi:signal recognition particle receptor subunit beta